MVSDDTVYRAILAWYAADHFKMRAALEAVITEIVEHAIVGALMKPITDVLCDPPEDLQDYIECDVERMEWKAKAEAAYKECARIAEAYDRQIPGMDPNLLGVAKRDIAYRIRKAAKERKND